MPEHSTWLSFLLAHARDTLDHNAHAFGATLLGKKHADWTSFEPITASLLVALLLVVLGLSVRSQVADVNVAVVPEARLSLRTFFEAFLGYFYDLAKSVMDAERAKKYFPVIGTGACFVFFSNVLSLVPGMPVPTTSLNITLGCALVVFILFNLYGIKENGIGYFKHLAGPAWYLSWLIFPLEVLSMCVRPISMAVRLMLNMAVDHLILTIFVSLVAVLVPLPVMILGVLVVVVQTLVFTLLTCIYIGLATEHEEHH
jgi:F-type H+-transporting ATPase subunit a